MACTRILLILVIGCGVIWALPTKPAHEREEVNIPPAIQFIEAFDKNYNREQIYKRVKSWSPEDKENVWELSGLMEGDIMPNPQKNGLVEQAKRWPGGVVPYHIQEEDFAEKDIAKIEAAIADYHEKSCLRFRPYTKTDKDFIVFQGSASGCWSSVGRQGKGQLINLQNPGCLSHGTIIHEMLHAVGFYHQQSSFDRDDFVEIVWDNISQGKESNFKKYSQRVVTDFGAGYDYGSVMHYSAKAFSSNGKATIVPLKEGVFIGQREGFSKKDILKLQAMYSEECRIREEKEKSIINTLNFLTDNHQDRRKELVSSHRRSIRSFADDNDKEILNRVNEWNEEDEENIWELSGLLEGDIMINRDGHHDVKGLIDSSKRWLNGIIPFTIKSNQFNSSDIAVMEKAMEEYHQRTCLIFRPYNKTIDKDYISFQSTKPGCWSSVGRQSAGQAINLQRPKCVKHGSIVHELMHAIGFHHQHSTYNRDNYIQVAWENIKAGKEKNFKKYEDDTVTDFGVGYDYKSIMHYSRKVFSANGKPTIIPMEAGVKIGQREKLSDKDVRKIQEMYKDECVHRRNTP